MSALKIMLFMAVVAQQPSDSVEMPKVEMPPVQQVGRASWYGAGNWHGSITANGEKFDPQAQTCAHRNLPFNTMVMVENTANHRRAWCRINDRGPYGIVSHEGRLEARLIPNQDGRIIDLSMATSRKLGLFDSGVGTVRIRYWTPHSQDHFALARRRPSAASTASSGSSL
jgi:rare lipoprotein A